MFGDEVAAAWEQDAAKRELRVKECTYHFPLAPDEVATKLDQRTEERQCPKCLERFMVSSIDIWTRSPAANPQTGGNPNPETQQHLVELLLCDHRV